MRSSPSPFYRKSPGEDRTHTKSQHHFAFPGQCIDAHGILPLKIYTMQIDGPAKGLETKKLDVKLNMCYHDRRGRSKR